MIVEEKSKVKRVTDRMVSNPCPKWISGGGGVNFLLAIQGFEAYKGLSNTNAARKCIDLPCVFRPHCSLIKAEKNSCSHLKHKSGLRPPLSLEREGKNFLKSGANLEIRVRGIIFIYSDCNKPKHKSGLVRLPQKMSPPRGGDRGHLANVMSIVTASEGGRASPLLYLRLMRNLTVISQRRASPLLNFRIKPKY